MGNIQNIRGMDANPMQSNENNNRMKQVDIVYLLREVKKQYDTV